MAARDDYQRLAHGVPRPADCDAALDEIDRLRTEVERLNIQRVAAEVYVRDQLEDLVGADEFARLMAAEDNDVRNFMLVNHAKKLIATPAERELIDAALAWTQARPNGSTEMLPNSVDRNVTGATMRGLFAAADRVLAERTETQ